MFDEKWLRHFLNINQLSIFSKNYITIIPILQKKIFDANSYATPKEVASFLTFLCKYKMS